MIIDMFVTFVGQPAGFWSNQNIIPNEGSLVGFWFLEFHNPFIFIAVNILYLLIVYLVFTYALLTMRKRLSIIYVHL